MPLLAAKDVACGVTACRHRIARRDGFDHGTVLLLHRHHEVVAARFVAARDAHAFAQVLLQKAEQQAKLRVAGGFANDAVKLQVFGHTVAAFGDRLVDGLERSAQLRDLGPCGAIRGQRCNLAFEHPPHLDDMHHRLDRLQHGGVECERQVLWRRGHEHAGPLACHHQRA